MSMVRKTTAMAIIIGALQTKFKELLQFIEYFLSVNRWVRSDSFSGKINNARELLFPRDKILIPVLYFKAIMGEWTKTPVIALRVVIKKR